MEKRGMDEEKAKDREENPTAHPLCVGGVISAGVRSPQLGRGSASSESGKEGTGAGSREGWPGSS